MLNFSLKFNFSLLYLLKYNNFPSSDYKRTSNSSLDSPRQGESNGIKFIFLGLIDSEIRDWNRFYQNRINRKSNRI